MKTEDESVKTEVVFDYKKLGLVFVGVLIVAVVFLLIGTRDEGSQSLNGNQVNFELSDPMRLSDANGGGDQVDQVNELIIEDIEIGTGEEAVTGKTVSVHYTGTLTDGTKFDSSLDRDTPFNFPLGGGRVIEGWDQGVVGMKVGGKRKLTIPYDLAYGESGTPDGSIPPRSTLIFEIELLSVE